MTTTSSAASAADWPAGAADGPRVAFQGVAGSYSEEAVQFLWRRGPRAHPTRSFAEALDLVLSGEVEWAVIPLWNSAIGHVQSACDAVAEREHALRIAREIYLPVRHCLLARPGATLDTVRFVGSHPAALAQCARFLAAHPRLVAHDAFDTAGGARELSLFERARERRDSTPAWYDTLPVDAVEQLGVIASRRAAQRYGLAILAADIHDVPNNVTRFAVLGARREVPAPTDAA